MDKKKLQQDMEYKLMKIQEASISFAYFRAGQDECLFTFFFDSRIIGDGRKYQGGNVIWRLLSTIF